MATKALEGRTAIVTGAGSAGDGIGNGRAAAIRLAEEGPGPLFWTSATPYSGR
ncbi:hypothetical protein [Aeromicrobium sp.]|uniref:hypothetical protein n=1 Tax=Aeromicrobium sp. TaxID=1871063 RepID=UPI0025C20F63|nr:hypothetical protein [Aeromicrobium sp.]